MDLKYSVDIWALTFIWSSLTIGMGYYGFLKLCEGTSFNAASSARKYGASQFLFDVMNIFFSEMCSWILPAIGKVYGAYGGGIREIKVSFDDTWMIRGHESHGNVDFVIECETGFV